MNFKAIKYALAQTAKFIGMIVGIAFFGAGAVILADLVGKHYDNETAALITLLTVVFTPFAIWMFVEFYKESVASDKKVASKPKPRKKR